MKLFLAFCLIAAFPLIAGLDAASASSPLRLPPVLVELFTSEGCSSCPPADRVLADLDRQGSVGGAPVIVLSEHVDYWDHLGWRDPFSSPQFSRRQEAYANGLGDRGVYTPQMVVDGGQGFVGSDKSDALGAISKAAKQPKIPVKIEIHGDEASVSIAQLPKNAHLWIAISENGLESSVARGENSGQRLAHTGVVRRLTDLGAVSEAQVALRLDPAWKRVQLRVVAFAQDRGTHRVLGAAAIPLPN